MELKRTEIGGVLVFVVHLSFFRILKLLCYFFFDKLFDKFLDIGEYFDELTNIFYEFF